MTRVLRHSSNGRVTAVKPKAAAVSVSCMSAEPG